MTDAEVAEIAAMRLVVADLVKHDPSARDHMERIYMRAYFIVGAVRQLIAPSRSDRAQ